LLLLAALAAAVWVGVRDRGPGNSVDPKQDEADRKPPAEPALRLSVAPALTLTAGDDQTVAVQVARTNCPGPVTVRAERMGPGLSASEGHLQAGQSAGAVRLTAESTVAAGERTVRLVAEADGVEAAAEVRVIVHRTRQGPLGMTFVKLRKGTFYMG